MSIALPSSLVRVHTLSDGAHAYTADPSLDATTAVFIAVYAQPSNEPVIPGELEVLLEWMQRGTQKHSRTALGDAFGALGIVPVLTTMQGACVFVLQCLDACREPALQLVRELLYEPLFDPDELADVLQEFDEDDRSSMDDPAEIVSRAQYLARWWGSTLSLPPNGSEHSRASLSAAYLQELHARIFTRPCMLGIGSAFEDQWLARGEALFFDGRPARTMDYTPISRTSVIAAPRNLVVHVPSMEHASVLRFSPGPSGSIDHMAAALLHHEALTDGMSAPLMAELRGQQALSYSVSSRLVDRNDLWDQLFEIEPEPGRIDEALQAVESLWTDPDLLCEEDLHRGRAQLATSLRLSTVDAGQVIATALRDEVLRGRPLGWRVERMRRIEALSAEEVLATAAQYGFSQSPICTVVVGPTSRMPAHYHEDAMDLKTLFAGTVDRPGK